MFGLASKKRINGLYNDISFIRQNKLDIFHYNSNTKKLQDEITELKKEIANLRSETVGEKTYLPLFEMLIGWRQKCSLQKQIYDMNELNNLLMKHLNVEVKTTESKTEIVKKTKK